MAGAVLTLVGLLLLLASGTRAARDTTVSPSHMPPPATAHSSKKQPPGTGRNLAQTPSEPELPQVSDGWYESFHTYDEVVERAEQLATDPRVTLVTLPRQSYEGQDIIALRVAGREGLSKRVVITGMLHAREWLAASATMLLVETLLSLMATDEGIVELLNTFELVIIPVMNPDGLRYTFRSGGVPCSSSYVSNCNRMWRKNRQLLSKSWCVGIDLNRAWPLDWGARGGEAVSESTCDELYSGEYPLQPPEALALCELLAELHGRDPAQLCGTGAVQRAADEWGMMALPEEGVVGFLDVHSYGQLLLGGWAHLNSPTYNGVTIGGIGEMMQEAVNEQCTFPGCRWSYGIGDLGGELYLSSGILTDWTQWAFGAPSYTVELPPRTNAQGGFDPDPSTILEYGDSLVELVRAMLRGLRYDWASEEEAARMERQDDNGGGKAAEWCPEGSSALASFQLRVLNRLDLYPREVSWSLIAPNGTSIAAWSAAKGGQREGDTATGGSVTLCAGLFVFEIRDEEDDGICCDQGSGNTRIYADEQVLFSSNGDFGESQTVAIALDTTPVVRLFNGSLDPGSPQLRQVIESLLNTFDTATVDTEHYLLGGVGSPLTPRGASAQGVITAVAVVIGAISLLIAAGLALSVWHRRRKARELAMVLEMRRGHLNAKSSSDLIAPSRPGSFSSSTHLQWSDSPASSKHAFNTVSSSPPLAVSTRRELRADSARSTASVALEMGVSGAWSPQPRNSNCSTRGALFSQPSTLSDAGMVGTPTRTSLLRVASSNGSSRGQSTDGRLIGNPESEDDLSPPSPHPPAPTAAPPGEMPSADGSLLGMPGSSERRDANSSGADRWDVVGVDDSVGEEFQFPVLPPPVNEVVWEE